MSKKQPNDKRNHRSGKITFEKEGRKRAEQIHDVEGIATGERRRIDEDALREREMSPKEGGSNLRDLTDEERRILAKREREDDVATEEGREEAHEEYHKQEQINIAGLTDEQRRRIIRRSRHEADREEEP